jgi:hypothetical protein
MKKVDSGDVFYQKINYENTKNILGFLLKSSPDNIHMKAFAERVRVKFNQRWIVNAVYARQTSLNEVKAKYVAENSILKNAVWLIDKWLLTGNTTSKMPL